MATTCKACGGTVIFPEGATVGICEYCGSTVTRSKIEDEQRDALHNRGNFLRMRGEYDRALSVFEQIIALDDTDAEAHWNAALCRYGIEYVKDPDTGKRIPTCHRANWDSILSDVDYLAALQYADSLARSVYESDGKYIDQVQKQILAISNTEDPYDIFICYKESSIDGNRTRDSVLAQDLYDRLTKEGYRVFFARVSLEDTLGKQYEPYIFSALNSAKVMLVVGTSAENINSPWVRNEWSRFLSLVKKDPGKAIIPCYRDMAPHDLPDELAVLQSQDLGKIGFTQDLLRGIGKFFSNNPNPRAKSEPQLEPTTAPLLKRAYMFLADRDWKSAETYFNRVLDMAPECGEAYAGLLCIEFKSDSLSNLSSYASPYLLTEERILMWIAHQITLSELTFENRRNYQRSIKYGTRETISTLVKQNDLLVQMVKNKKRQFEFREKEAAELGKQSAVRSQIDAETELLINCENQTQEAQLGITESKKKIDEYTAWEKSLRQEGEKSFELLKTLRNIEIAIFILSGLFLAICLHGRVAQGEDYLGYKVEIPLGQWIVAYIVIGAIAVGITAVFHKFLFRLNERKSEVINTFDQCDKYLKEKEENAQQITIFENQLKQLVVEKEQHENTIHTLQKRELLIQLIWTIKQHIEY